MLDWSVFGSNLDPADAERQFNLFKAETELDRDFGMGVVTGGGVLIMAVSGVRPNGKGQTVAMLCLPKTRTGLTCIHRDDDPQWRAVEAVAIADRGGIETRVAVNADTFGTNLLEELLESQPMGFATPSIMALVEQARTNAEKDRQRKADEDAKVTP